MHFTDRGLSEAEHWDRWAEGRPPTPITMTAEEWLANGRLRRRVRDALPPLDIPNSRILDIGGTCLDAGKFLLSGCRRMDHVEVSAASQELARRNLEASGIDPGLVQFHTTMAEELPFPAETFDIVFSRSTIHHTDRSQSVPEIHRVLKPGCALLMIEPALSSPMKQLMHGRRHVLSADRGTDDPFTYDEIR